MTVVDKVREMLSLQLDLDLPRLTPETEFQKLYEEGPLDSLGIVEFVLALEDEFEIDIPDEDIDKAKTIADVVEYVEKKRRR